MRVLLHSHHRLKLPRNPTNRTHAKHLNLTSRHVTTSSHPLPTNVLPPGHQDQEKEKEKEKKKSKTRLLHEISVQNTQKALLRGMGKRDDSIVYCEMRNRGMTGARVTDITPQKIHIMPRLELEVSTISIR